MRGGAHGIGKAGGAWTTLSGAIAFIYFFPVLWIILTAFKSLNDALAIPPKFFPFPNRSCGAWRIRTAILPLPPWSGTTK